MLHVGCSACGSVVPLGCAGQFMPHMPIHVVQTASGIYCQFCGIMPPFFTCTMCWTTQPLYLGGGLDPGFAGYQFAAPVVTAPPGTGQDVLAGLFKGVAKGAAEQLGEELVGSFFGMWGE